MRKLFSIFAALTLSVGLWAANSVITFTSTSNLYPVDIDELWEDAMMGDGAKWAAFKAQYPEFKDVMDPMELQWMGISSFNPNAFLDANDQVLNCTYNYDESTHAGTITVNGELVKIAFEAFSGCTALTSITLPEGVTSIAYKAFSNCIALTSITLPEGATSIGGYAFSGSALTSITLPEGVTSIESSVFSNCTALTSITLPEGVTSIGSSAFSGSALTSVILPESLSSIDTYGFYGCPLSSVTIPANVTYLGYCAFGGNSSLTDVYVAWTTTLPTLEENTTFSYSSIGTATLHVPVGSKALYQNADVWKGFGSIVEYTLQEIKDAAIAEINAAIDGVTDEAILAIATTAITNINNATTKEEVNTIKTQALADINLAKYKADAIAAVDAAVAGVTDESILAIATTAKTNIGTATTKSGVNSIKTQALADIAAAIFAKYKADAIAEIQTAGQGIQNTNLNNWINGAITDINAAGTDTKEKVDNIKNQILSMIQLFQDGKAEGLAEAQAALPTEGTSGPAVVITQGDKSITLINPDEVKYTIITEE